MSNTETSRKVLERWYDEMWAECNHTLVPEITRPMYIRHDITGANNEMKSEDYSALIALGTDGETVADFSYYLIAEENYVGAIGRLVFESKRQWDWVQLFRVEDSRLAETWLPGMGGNDPFGFPQEWTHWQGTEIPQALKSDSLIETAQKKMIREYYETVWLAGATEKLGQYFASELRMHDTTAAMRDLSLAEYQEEIKQQVSRTQPRDMQLFMVEESDYVIATASWKIAGDKQWDLTQAFRFENKKIVETWIPSIGGTDDSLNLGEHSIWPIEVMPKNSRLAK